MNERIKRRVAYLRSGEYKKLRRVSEQIRVALPEGTSTKTVYATLLEVMLKSETPVLYGDDNFGFNRTVEKLPVGVVGDTEHRGGIGNITVNYAYALKNGMDVYLHRIEAKLSDYTDKEKRITYESMRRSVAVCLDFADRYREHAREQGAERLYRALCRVPHKGADSFYEACVFLKFLQCTLRANQNDHITLGGFDKYMLPYFEADLARGVGEEELFYVLEDFFISLNFDSDTYFGFQQGDNGMSMVLGGRAPDGTDRYNRLSELCLKASMELCLIDPKINLRVDKNTPIQRLEYATELTKKGLGFPQYSNDDVVIPGLIALGYAPEDAYDYTVAACWEFIIPAKSFDIPNLSKVNFPLVILRAVKEGLADADSFDAFLDAVRAQVRAECVSVAEKMAIAVSQPSPYLSVFVDDCIERGLDVSEGGAIYSNYGAHGVGISTAADSIAAVKRAVFEEKFCTARQLIDALERDFCGYPELRNYLLSCPKMGNNDPRADIFADLIMDIFTDTFKKYKNVLGGVLRPGTGSAMEYLLSAARVGATPDGRGAGTPFASSFSPSPTTRLSGPLSCIQSFTRYDMKRIINGGPLTMELHDNVFRNPEGISKVALLVKAFVDLGGHQLQLNSVNRDVLLDAQRNPDSHRNLIVRVWGWSGYFCELDKAYQDHVISRTEFLV